MMCMASRMPQFELDDSSVGRWEERENQRKCKRSKLEHVGGRNKCKYKISFPKINTACECSTGHTERYVVNNIKIYGFAYSRLTLGGYINRGGTVGQFLTWRSASQTSVLVPAFDCGPNRYIPRRLSAHAAAPFAPSSYRCNDCAFSKTSRRLRFLCLSFVVSQKKRKSRSIIQQRFYLRC